jgi:hypothetical protein
VKNRGLRNPVSAGPLGDLGALCVINGPSHAKNAKGTKDCIVKNRGLRNPVSAGPLGDLGALRVMNGPSHAKNAKDAKECIEENKEDPCSVALGVKKRVLRAIL